MISPTLQAFISKHLNLASLNSSLPKEFDERTWYILYACVTFCILILAYLLNRSVCNDDLEKNRIYIRARYHSAHRKQTKPE